MTFYKINITLGLVNPVYPSWINRPLREVMFNGSLGHALVAFAPGWGGGGGYSL